MTTSRVEFAPVTQELAERFYGGPAPWSFQGHVALLDGEPVGLGGIFYCNGHAFAFTEMKDALRARKRDKARCVRVLEPLLTGFKGMLYAVACEPTSAGMLKRLGFRDLGTMIEAGRAVGPLWARY